MSARPALLPAALATIALALPAPAAAKCALLSESEAVNASDVVFEGVVSAAEQGSGAELSPGKPPASLTSPREFGFRVARYLSGAGADRLVVRRSSIQDSFPRTDPRPGEAWRVYARRGSSGDFLFSPCVPYSERLSGAEAEQVRVQLRRAAARGDDEEDGGPPLVLLLAAGAVLLGTLALGLRRRRGS